MLLSTRRLRATIATLATVLPLVLTSPALASTSVSAAAASQYNGTPDCPVSAADPVCAWNVATDSDNPFTAADYGQCPYWAAEKYPALVAGESSSDPDGDDWNGSTWAEHAQQEGLSLSDAPASGDLAVWQAESADPSGHVAYVEAVVDGGIIVSQMDGDSSAPYPAMQGSTEWISDAALTYFQQQYGLEFVQTGEASSTPVSYVELASPPAKKRRHHLVHRMARATRRAHLRHSHRA